MATMHELAKNVAIEAINTILVDGKTIKQWMEEIKAMRWISVKDRLPVREEKVLVRGIRGGIQAGVFRGLLGENVGMWWWKKNSALEVVCWMPQSALPEPPKEDAHA